MEKQITLSCTEYQQLLGKIKGLEKYIQESEVNGKIKVRKIPVYRETRYLSYYLDNPEVIKDPLMGYDEIGAEENEIIKNLTQELLEAHTEKAELKEKLEEANSKLEEANSKIPWYRKKQNKN